jgi:hypothetical protein
MSEAEESETASRNDIGRMNGPEGADRPVTLDHSGPPNRDRQWRGVNKKTG